MGLIEIKDFVKKITDSKVNTNNSSKLVEYKDNGNIKIHGKPFNEWRAGDILGRKERVDYMFYNFGWFSMEFPAFFKYEFIRMLEYCKEVKGARYGINVKLVDECLRVLRDRYLDQIENQNTYDTSHIDKVFDFKPRPHQQEIMDDYLKYKLINGYRGMLLNAAVGSGKTMTALYIMEGLHKQVDKVVVICPLPTLDKVWMSTLSGQPGTGLNNKIPYWSLSSNNSYGDERYILCHYEALDKLMLNINKFNNEKVGIIVDEVHNFNDPKSKRTALLKEIIDNVQTDNVMLLSGTPIKSGFKELATMFKLLDSSFTTDTEQRYYNLYKNCNTFLLETLTSRFRSYSKYVAKDVIKLDPLNTVNLKITIPDKELQEYSLKKIVADVKNYIKIRKAELEAEYPKWETEYIRLRDLAYSNSKSSKEDFDRYKNCVEIIKRTSGFNYNTIQTELIYANKYEKEVLIPNLSKDDKVIFKDAKTIYKYLVLKVRGEALSNILGRARINCHSLLLDYIDFPSIINSTKKKTIIFSNYIDVCKKLEAKMIDIGYSPICVYGDTTKDLASSVQKFMNDNNVNPLITTYKSLSTGVPLIAADTIICIDLPFRMYIYEQAVGRAWRLGQDSQVTSYIVEIDSKIPTINSRGIDIITYFDKEVEKITGFKSNVSLKEEEGSLSTESLDYEDLILENTDINITTEAKSNNPKRKQVEELILKYIDRIVTGGTNTDLYKDLFNNMTNQQFDQFMKDLRDGKRTLQIIVPNNDKRYKCSVENNYKLAKELGFEFFQRIKVGKSKDLPAYTTPNKYMLLKLPVRRAAQLLTKKISIPEHNRQIDSLSGQVMGDSKGAKLTNPELQILLGLGLKDSIKELMKSRGGDLGAGGAMDAMLVKHGSANLETVDMYSTGVVSKDTLKAYFNSMHIKNTL